LALTEVWGVFEEYAESHDRLVTLYDNRQDAEDSCEFFDENFEFRLFEVRKVQVYGKHNH
jgi:hypothetical protein